MAMAAASKAIDDLPQDHLESGNLLWTKWIEAPSRSSCFATGCYCFEFYSFVVPRSCSPSRWARRRHEKHWHIKTCETLRVLGKGLHWCSLALASFLSFHFFANRSTTCDLWLKTLRGLAAWPGKVRIHAVKLESIPKHHASNYERVHELNCLQNGNITSPM